MIPPRTAPNGRPYVSPSQVQLVSTCGAKWRYRYVEKVPDPMGLDALIGIAVHTGLEHHPDDPYLAPEEAIKALETLLANADLRPEDQARIDEDEAAIYEEVEALAKATAQYIYTEAWIQESAEGWVQAPLTPDVDLRGRYDAIMTINGVQTLIDYKTTKRSPSGGIATRAHAAQQQLYAHALADMGTPVEAAGILYIVRNKSPKLVYAPVDVSQDAQAWAWGLARDAVAKIMRDDLRPEPYAAGYLCDSRYCAAWDLCPGAARWETGGDA